MPHKHVRSTKNADSSTHDLPPTAVATSLPVTLRSTKKPYGSDAGIKRKPGKAQINDYKNDDTPQAFRRLMQLQETGKGPKGLDDGDWRKNGSKKRKRGDDELPVSSLKPTKASTNPETASEGTSAKVAPLTILPGERMFEFSARVNQALPLAGLARKGSTKHSGTERKTRMEKKMQKMQGEWRKENARRMDREQAALDKAEEEDAENFTIADFATNSKNGRKGRGPPDDGDPWTVLQREKPKGLHDTVKAPPNLKKFREKFKIKDGARLDVADVPGMAGSLRRREELGSARQNIIDSYRRMMQERRSVVA